MDIHRNFWIVNAFQRCLDGGRLGRPTSIRQLLTRHCLEAGRGIRQKIGQDGTIIRPGLVGNSAAGPTVKIGVVVLVVHRALPKNPPDLFKRRG